MLSEALPKTLFTAPGAPDRVYLFMIIIMINATECFMKAQHDFIPLILG